MTDPIGCQIFKNVPWHSQRDLSEFFNKSVKTINEHLYPIEEKDHIVLRSTRTEGDRTVTRKIRYYSFNCAAKLCYLTGSFSHTQKYKDFLQELGIIFPESIPITADGNNIRSYLGKIFSGVIGIEFEKRIGPYRVDGFIPNLRMFFEIDGKDHDDKNTIKKDKQKEDYLIRKYPDYDLVRFNTEDFPWLINLIIKKIALQKEKTMKFLDALNDLLPKGPGFRMHRESKPGLLSWLNGQIVESNHPLTVEDMCAVDWIVIEDDTVLR